MVIEHADFDGMESGEAFGANVFLSGIAAGASSISDASSTKTQAQPAPGTPEQPDDGDKELGGRAGHRDCAR